jgi:predicted aldo/keto reductase-like oxidoreductase
MKMIYKNWNKTGDSIGILGFGAMRLPTLKEDPSKIDEEKAIKLIRSGIDEGINYLDTAWPYHDGQSEALCAKVMKDGYREKIFIATKLPSWEIKKHEDMMSILDKQLKKLEVDYIDYYLLHSLQQDHWNMYKRLDYKKFLREAKAQGKIRQYGFSFHDHGNLFKEILDDFDWDFTQIQLNYLDQDYQAGFSGLKYAFKKKIPVIIMEPLRGGMLAMEPPEDIQAILNNSGRKYSPAEWALRFLWDREEVAMVLSGMTLPEQLEENLAVAKDAHAGHLSEADRLTIENIRQAYKSKIRVNCTNCRYCMPCPTGVYIPELFWAYNHDGLFGDFGKAKFWATGFLKEEQRASKCIECGICMDHCPQNIPIPSTLKKIAAIYEDVG